MTKFIPIAEVSAEQFPYILDWGDVAGIVGQLSRDPQLLGHLIVIKFFEEEV